MKNKIFSIIMVMCCVTLMTSTLFYVREYYNLKNVVKEKDDLLWEAQVELAFNADNLDLEIAKSAILASELDIATKELTDANEAIAELTNSEYEFVYMGDFKITYYCDERYSHICGGNGVTASGKNTEVGWTAAADWSVLPKGSVVYIYGVGFREIQDVGGAVNDNHIDVLVQEHQEALNFGTDYNDVWLLIKKDS